MADADAPPNVYKEHFEEIRRRRDVIQDGNGVRDSVFGPSSGASPTTYALADQYFVLYSLAHRSVPPVAPRGHVRIYGIFSTVDEAAEHGRLLKESTNASILLAPAREWLVGAESMERLQDAATMIAHRDETLRAYHAALERAQHDFEKATSAVADDMAHAEDCDVTDGDPVDEAEDDEEDALPEGCKRSKLSLPATARISGQRFAVVSFVNADEFLLSLIHI